MDNGQLTMDNVQGIMYKGQLTISIAELKVGNE